MTLTNLENEAAEDLNTAAKRLESLTAATIKDGIGPHAKAIQATLKDIDLCAKLLMRRSNDNRTKKAA